MPNVRGKPIDTIETHKCDEAMMRVVGFGRPGAASLYNSLYNHIRFIPAIGEVQKYDG